MKIKIILNSICFIFLLIIIALFLSRIIIFDVDDLKLDSYRVKTSLEEPKNSTDVIFIGPSSAYCSWISAVGWEYGFSSSIFSASNLPGSALKYVIKETMKNQKPKLLVLFVDGLLEAPKKEECSNFHTFIQFISIPKRFFMVNAMAKESNLSISERMEYFFPIIRLHSKWTNLFSENTLDFIPRGVLYAHSKYYTKENNLPDYIDNSIINDSDSVIELSKERKEIIGNLFKYLSTLNIPVLLISAPGSQFLYSKNYYFNVNKEYNAIFKMADEYNLPYIDLRKINVIKEMNLNKSDYMDYGHFNFYGAYKFSHYLAKILKEKYDLGNAEENENNYLMEQEYQEYIDFLKSEYNINTETLFRK